MATKKKDTDTLAEEIKEIDNTIKNSSNKKVEYVVYEEKNIAAIKGPDVMLNRYPEYDVFDEYAKKVDKLEKEIKKNRKFRWIKKRRFY